MKNSVTVNAQILETAAYHSFASVLYAIPSLGGQICHRNAPVDKPVFQELSAKQLCRVILAKGAPATARLMGSYLLMAQGNQKERLADIFSNAARDFLKNGSNANKNCLTAFVAYVKEHAKSPTNTLLKALQTVAADIAPKP